VAQPIAHPMPFGAELQPGGEVRFRLWAPAQDRIGLAIEGETEIFQMSPCRDGWHELITRRARAGSRYRYVMGDGSQVPDPASRFQPEDVHGPSEVIDPASYGWSNPAWNGRPWAAAVLYELHVGTFSQEGTFQAAAGKLGHLRDLGITAIEIMPVADFPGRCNWGYDGVLLYAPDSSYGRPEDLKALVDAAHANGIMVLLDVVYNHFGPEGNYLRSYAPQFFTASHKTPWGDGINFDGPDGGPVREFMIHNALYWVEEYRLDGLRLDAVHAMRDDSPKHIAVELAERVRAQAGVRQIHLLLENEENQASLLERNATGEPIWFTAQWNDDAHHVLHTAVTGEHAGYYVDYRSDTEKMGRTLAEGFAFQGEPMPYRGRARGEPSAKLPPGAFVAFLQNHDQIGNRAFGERLGQLTSAKALRAAGAVYLLLPEAPMLFMGEEWNASQPFPFFCDFGGELVEAVRRGRREEFARFPEFQDPAQWMRIPDPQASGTFQSAKLRWDETDLADHAAWLDWYRAILRVRRERIVPILAGILGNAGGYEVIGEEAVIVRWRVGPDALLTLAANLSDKPQTGFPAPSGSALWQEGGPDPGAAWSVCWWLT
jgi:malto-oligosyltrehalose trehalohydrolase